jgi:carboxyl-terminal processing protease
MIKRLFFVLLLGALTGVAAHADVPAKSGSLTLKPSTDQAQAAVLTARFLTRFEYDAKPLDDAMSAKIFKAYLKALDGDKLYFTKTDVEHFSGLRDTLDDAIWNQNLSGPFRIFNLYVERATQRLEYARSLLKKGFDFNKDETYDYDRDKAKWAPDQKALDALWQKRVKNDWLRLKLAGKDAKDIRTTLDKRYKSYLDRIHQLDSQDAFQTFMNAYATTTDPHTDYFGPRRAANFAIAMKLSLEGIGAVLQSSDEYTMVREVVPGGPAEKSGQIHVGDRIVGVGQGKDGAIKDVIGWRIDDVVAKIRGKKDTTLRLEIIPAKTGLDGKHEVVTLVRKKVTLAEQSAKKKLIQVKDGDVTRRIGVIELPSFYEDFAAREAGDPDYKSATRDVAKLIKQLKKDKVDGIIVDLRSNGGGSLSEAASLTGLFIDKGPVVQVRQSNGSVHEESDDDPGMAWSGPLAVLVNRGTASASEIFAAAIQDYGRGLIIGAPTFGKGSVQNLVNLDRFSSGEKKHQYGELKMTIAKFFRITGGSTQLRGVTPDIAFPKSGNEKLFGESTYPNAMPWTHIQPAHYKPVGNLKMLVPMLEHRHLARIEKLPGWKLMLDELHEYLKNRDQTMVSLDYTKRLARRKHNEAIQKAFRERHKVIDGDKSDTDEVLLDDGLTPNERSITDQVKQEKEADKATDVTLDEAAHIVADEVGLIQSNTKLAAQVLPYHGKKPVMTD